MRIRAPHKSKHFFFYSVKYLIPVIALFIILDQLTVLYKKDQAFLSELIEQGLGLPISLGLVMLLMSIANWFLEGKKWQLAVNAATAIDFYTAIKQCLMGFTTSLLTPAKAGDYIAKPLFFPAEYRKRILLLNTVNHLCQLSVTGIFGVLSLLILASYVPDITGLIDLEYVLISITFVAFLLLSVVFFFKQKKHKRYLEWKNACAVASKQIWFYLMGLSVLRYLVFSFQFIFMLVIFGATIQLGTAFVLLSVIHLINSSLPTPALSDAVVKGSLGVLLFGMFEVNTWMVLLATAFMWLFNQAVPALLGAFYLTRYKRNNLS
jgi:hypothetical protein